MKSDIRLVEEDVDGELEMSIQRIIYNGEGEIVNTKIVHFDDIVEFRGDLYAAIDEIYRASLKPVLFKIEGGYL